MVDWGGQLSLPSPLNRGVIRKGHRHRLPQQVSTLPQWFLPVSFLSKEGNFQRRHARKIRRALWGEFRRERIERTIVPVDTVGALLTYNHLKVSVANPFSRAAPPRGVA